MKSLYEGILDDVDTAMNRMEDDLEASYEFPDKKEGLWFYKSGLRYYEWVYPAATDNDAVKKLLKAGHMTYHEPGHYLATRIRVKIYTKRDNGIYKHRISIGISGGYAFTTLGAYRDLEDVSIRKATDYAYEVLKIIKLNPKMIEWLAEKQEKNGYKAPMFMPRGYGNALFDEAMNKFNKR
jgi:hypothetical protein